MENCKTNYYRCGQEILLAFRVAVQSTGVEALDDFISDIVAEIRKYADALAEQLSAEYAGFPRGEVRPTRHELWVRSAVEQPCEKIYRVSIRTTYAPLHAPAEVSGVCVFDWDPDRDLCVRRARQSGTS